MDPYSLDGGVEGYNNPVSIVDPESHLLLRDSEEDVKP